MVFCITIFIEIWCYFPLLWDTHKKKLTQHLCVPAEFCKSTIKNFIVRGYLHKGVVFSFENVGQDVITANNGLKNSSLNVHHFLKKIKRKERCSSKAKIKKICRLMSGKCKET